MNIIQLASLYPINDSPQENPYVKKFSLLFKESHPENRIIILKPVTYLPFPTFFLSRQQYWSQKRKISKKKSVFEDGLDIYFIPFFAIASISFLFPLFSYMGYFLSQKKIKKILSNKVDFIHAHYLFPDGLFAYLICKKYKIPYTITMQDERRFLNNKIGLFFTKKILGKSQGPTTLSYKMNERLNQLNIHNIKLVSIGINNIFFSKPNIFVPRNDDVFKLVSVCNLLPVKNIASVVRAISLIDTNNQIKYDIYGSGELENDLKKLTNELGLNEKVKFKGTIENSKLIEILPSYDLFIQPSFKESFGLSYFEALACGLPVVLTENTGAYHLIKNKNVYFLVDPNSIYSIKEVLDSILKNPMKIEEMKRTAIETSRVASWDIFLQYFDVIYSKFNFHE